MKVTATIPEELGRWAEERIGTGEFYNWSHVVNAALKSFKEAREGQSPLGHSDNPDKSPSGNGHKVARQRNSEGSP